jgi:hypothetical protein
MLLKLRYIVIDPTWNCRVGHAELALGPRRFIVQAETSGLYCLLAHRTRKLSRHCDLARDNRGVAQPGRALRLGRRCRRFNSCHPDQLFMGWEALRRSRAEMASTGAALGAEVRGFESLRPDHS